MQTLATDLRLPVRGSDPSGLILEQERWAGGVGVVTRLDLVKALSAALSGTIDENEIICGVDDSGAYLSGLYVYPFSPSLSYDIGITHGTLGDRIIQEVEVRELVEFRLETAASVKYPIRNLIKAEWGADTWDGEGAVISDPSISVNGQDVSLSKPVYGTVIVTYRTVRHARHLRVPTREDAVENVYDSYAWARWNGGVELLKLKPPEGAEENYLNNQNCIWGGRLNPMPPDDPDGPPTASPEYKTVNIDYCSQTELKYYV